MILCRGTYLVAEIGSTVPGYSPLNDHFFRIHNCLGKQLRTYIARANRTYSEWRAGNFPCAQAKNDLPSFRAMCECFTTKNGALEG